MVMPRQGFRRCRTTGELVLAYVGGCVIDTTEEWLDAMDPWRAMNKECSCALGFCKLEQIRKDEEELERLISDS